MDDGYFHVYFLWGPYPVACASSWPVLGLFPEVFGAMPCQGSNPVLLHAKCTFTPLFSVVSLIDLNCGEVSEVYVPVKICSVQAKDMGKG